MQSVKTYILPKTSTVHCHSHNLSPRIHSPGKKFWELSLDVGDKRDLFSFVSKKCCLLDGLDIANRQTNLRRDGTQKRIIILLKWTENPSSKFGEMGIFTEKGVSMAS